MDPASAIIGVASGAAGIVAITTQIIAYFICLRDNYQNALPIVLDLITTCQVFEVGWKRLRTWAIELEQTGVHQISANILQDLMSFRDNSRMLVDLVKADLDRSLAAKREAGRRLITACPAKGLRNSCSTKRRSGSTVRGYIGRIAT